MHLQKQNLTPLQALQKLKHYCAYQERCHKEVKEKLSSYGVYNQDADVCVSTLIEENYLNEERFAIAYAGGKYRIKKWGRTKIKYSLKQKQVSEYCIKKALVQIDDTIYMQNLNDLFEKKLNSLKSEKNIFVKKKKIREHLQLQGFEMELIIEKLKEI
jgi:regulatory protein